MDTNISGQSLAEDSIQTIRSHLIDQIKTILGNADPVHQNTPEILKKVLAELSEQIDELENHRLSYLHPVGGEKDSGWQSIVDYVTGGYIESIREVRRIYGYEIQSAKTLVDTYRARKYAYATHPRPYEEH